MSAKKISTLPKDSLLQIEWGNFTRSAAVEAHLQNTAQKILARAKGATHLVISLATEISGPRRSNDLMTVNFELRLPKHQDLFAQSEGRNLYEVISECKQNILRQLSDRKSLKIHKRTESSILSELIAADSL